MPFSLRFGRFVRLCQQIMFVVTIKKQPLWGFSTFWRIFFFSAKVSNFDFRVLFDPFWGLFRNKNNRKSLDDDDDDDNVEIPLFYELVFHSISE